MNNNSQQQIVVPKSLINSALSNFISTNNFTIEQIDQIRAGDGMLGFMGEHLKLIISYVFNGKSFKISFFAKCYPKNNPQRAALNDVFETFKREKRAYMEIFTKFVEYNELESWHAKCLDANEEILIFEDLSQRGFKMRSIRECLDQNHCIVTLRALAKLHASTIILEETASKKPHRLGDSVQTQKFKDHLVYGEWTRVSMESALSLAKKSENFGELTPHFDKVKRRWQEKTEEGLNVIFTTENDLRHVLAHNDLWNNNIMFRYANNEPVQCIFVDFQAFLVSSPTLDLMSFMHLNLDKTQRVQHLDSFIRYYYSEVSEIFAKHHLRVQEIFPWESFKKSCDRFKQFALIHSMMLYQFIFMNDEEVFMSVNDSEKFQKLVFENREIMLNRYLENDEVFKKRMMENIDEFISEYII